MAAAVRDARAAPCDAEAAVHSDPFVPDGASDAAQAAAASPASSSDLGDLLDLGDHWDASFDRLDL